MSARITMPIQKAQVLAADSGIAELIEAVTHALEEGWTVVDFVEVEEGQNVEVRPHTGVMVAWMLPEYIAKRLQVLGGEEDLHLTLAYLGDIEGLTLEQQRELVGIVAEVVSSETALYGLIQGLGTFPPHGDATEFPWWAGVLIPGLAELRAKVVAALVDAGMPVDMTYTDWNPHITLAYISEGEEQPQVTLDPIPMEVSSLTVALAGERRTVELKRPDWDEGDWWEQRNDWYKEQTGQEYPYEEGTAYRPFAKAVVENERRFTLGPWYIPGILDAHGEWTDAEELQRSLWRYVDSGYRGIHVQHMPDVVAGRWVELMTLPHATTWPVIDPRGEVAAHEYPAGTVMMGVIWDDWAWELVKSGAISGYSIGGNAGREEADPDDGSNALVIE